jgi:hypothetical protein
MIVFDIEVKIKWEHNFKESKIKKKNFKVQFLANQMFKDKIEKKNNIIKKR